MKEFFKKVGKKMFTKENLLANGVVLGFCILVDLTWAIIEVVKDKEA